MIFVAELAIYLEEFVCKTWVFEQYLIGFVAIYLTSSNSNLLKFVQMNLKRIHYCI